MNEGLGRLVELECKRLCELVDDGALTCIEALTRAVMLGAEYERLDVMHRACEDYTRAREARERAFSMVPRVSSRPPPG